MLRYPNMVCSECISTGIWANKEQTTPIEFGNTSFSGGFMSIWINDWESWFLSLMKLRHAIFAFIKSTRLEPEMFLFGWIFCVINIDDFHIFFHFNNLVNWSFLGGQCVVSMFTVKPFPADHIGWLATWHRGQPCRWSGCRSWKWVFRDFLKIISWYYSQKDIFVKLFLFIFLLDMTGSKWALLGQWALYLASMIRIRKRTTRGTNTCLSISHQTVVSTSKDSKSNTLQVQFGYLYLSQYFFQLWKCRLN